MFAAGGGQPAADPPGRPQLAGVVDTVQRVLFLADPGRHRRSCSRPGGGRPRRRAGGRCCPAWRVRLACCSSRCCWSCDLVTGGEVAGAALDRRVLADHGPAGVPRRAAALAAGAGGLADLFRRPARDAARSSCRPRSPACSATRACCIAYPPRRRPLTSTPTAARSTLPDAGARTGRSRRSNATASAVAVLVYDRSLDDDPELVEAIGAAATIALENRQLHAEAEARLAELQASRERIVTAADAERRRIERNLHDGAQQRLVTLALQLSLIRRADPPRPRRRRAARRVRERRAGRSRWRSCASSPAASTRPRSTRGWSTRWRRWPCARRCRPRCLRVRPAAAAGTGRVRGVLRGVGGAGQRGQVRPGVGGDGAGAGARPTTPSIEIADDGVGGADPARGTGLRGLADRVEALGGRLGCRARPPAARSSPRRCRCGAPRGPIRSR